MITLDDALRDKIQKIYNEYGREDFIKEFNFPNGFSLYNIFRRGKLKPVVYNRLKEVINIMNNSTNHFNVINTEYIENFADLTPESYSDDEQELVNTYKEIARTFIAVFDELLYEIMNINPLSQSPVIWGMAFAIGSKHLQGRSMSEVAQSIGCSRAAISKQARRFIKVLNFPVSPYMRTEENVKICREVRLKKVNK